MIELINFSKSYGSKIVLDQINLQFEKGTVNGIVGENGSGKTTLFKSIAGLQSYIGKIESSFHTLKNHIGYLDTNPFFFSKITGEEYLTLLRQSRNKKTITTKDQNLFDIPLNQYAVTYSTGMKKKLALTGLLLQGNDVFILDEPYSGVDIQSNMMITEIIHKLKAMNKIVLISSHIFSTLSETCDVIHLLKDSRVLRSADKPDFDKLDAEMKRFTIGDKIDKLDIG